MTKSLLFAASLVLSTGAFAQYTINQGQAPKPGDINYTVIDTTPGDVSKGAAGQGKMYDLTALNGDVDAYGNWGDASGAPNSADFPEADLTYDDGTGQLAYFDLTSSRLDLVGFMFALTGTPAPLRMTNPQSYLRFPSAFGTTYKDTSSWKTSFYFGQEAGGFKIDSIRISNNSRYDKMFDGSGDLHTFTGMFSDVIRERAVIISDQKTEVCIVFATGFPCQWVDAGTVNPAYGSTKDTTVTYTWYGSKSSSDLASLTYNFKEDTLIEGSFNNDPNLVGVAEYTRMNGAVYPNPAQDFFYVKSTANIEAVRISDIQGRLIKSVKPENNNRVDIAGLVAGQYIISIITSEGISTDKLSVTR